MTEITLSSVGGEYMESAVLVEWTIADGAAVVAGQVIALVETVKATVEIEAPAEGILAHLAKVGDEIAVGAALARLGEAAASATLPVDQPRAMAEGPQGRPVSGMPRRWPEAYASPLAKRLAAERGIDLSGLRGSGPNGRIIKADLPSAQRPVSPGCYRMAREVDITFLQEERATRWHEGDHASLGLIVAEAAEEALRAMALPWSLSLDEETYQPNRVTILDFARFGIAEVQLPPAVSGAALALTLPAEGRLHLSLVADPSAFPCMTAAQWLARLGAALERPLA